MVTMTEENYFAHYGILRRSGRYPWGSGGNQPTRNRMFLDYVEEMKAKGYSDVEIAKGTGMFEKGYGFSTTTLIALKSIAKNQQRQAQISLAQKYKDKGMSNVAIGKKMDINESQVRALLKPGASRKNDILMSTAKMLREEVAAKKYLDVGTGVELYLGEKIVDPISGVENYLGISKEKLNVAIAVLQEEGYKIWPVKTPQIGVDHETRRKILTPPGTTQRDVFLNRDKIKTLSRYSNDSGLSFTKTHEPIPVDPKRVAVRYGDEGGTERDGVIYIREGVKDLSLGNARYAQVRIKVGDKNFLKGMALYSDDLPPGVDILFNTNKRNETGNKLDVMKKLSDDKDLPFESIVRQIVADEGTPNEHVTSAMNLVYDEGQWKDWAKSISAQALSKQRPSLARDQLVKTFAARKEEFASIMELTNPTVKRKLLETFAESTDSAAAHLKAVALPNSRWSVILPVESLSPLEVYAPTYNDGEQVALIRYPHGGTFEIPELTVNNRNPEARKALGNAEDAIGIHYKVAERLSGADFDGDTVLVIPNNNKKIKSTPALEGLKNFDPKNEYRGYPGMIGIGNRKQQEMGNISNLITDMTIKLASHDEIVRAIRHSMVVIDAENHNLDYKESARRNGISQLKAEYQGSARSGASTLISKARSPKYVLDRKPRPHSEGGPIDLQTGERMFVDTGKLRTNKQGVKEPKKQRSTKIAETTNALTLSSGTPIEKLYGDYANNLKDLANKSRLAAINTPRAKWSESAKNTYAKEVASLNSKLILIKKNRPRERAAQDFASNVVKAKRDANPNLDKEVIKKIKFQALSTARSRQGITKEQRQIRFTANEWDAIQAGAISDSKLRQMLDKADLTKVRELATPRTKLLMTPSNTSRARGLLARGATRAEVAKVLGVSVSTLDRSLTSGGGD